ncbi:MAG: Crossover junction endonuclease mus81 [Alectoria fallacina]|uniref:Crossover junction endonuclease MUS81 n=1 Tax=Alectoria fallacina TaxID=1903189 RepID=A0A8H3FHA1_9LECA|nr:MAG: Crossover junction endonuclease mus81 [Alectoria fallacina]
MAPTCANPLLLEWIKEIYDLAKERNTKGVTTYKRAYESMKACPLTFSHPSEAQQLDGIGPKICDRLTEKLKEHCEANGLPAPKKPRGKARKRLSAEELVDGEEPAATPAKKPRKAKPYVPSLRSGPYALVLALSSMPEESLQSLSKKEVIELAQPHCESSFTVPSESGNFYTAWNSMTTLVNKDLVQEKGRPLRKYALTEDGWEVAKRIKAVQAGEIGGKATHGFKGKQGSDNPKKPGSRGQTGDAADRFLDLEDDFEEEEPLRPLPISSASENNIKHPEPTPGPCGQRLGGAPFDKYGTFSKSQTRGPSTASKRNVVELLSSPEPENSRGMPWASSDFDQDSRSLTSNSASKSLQQSLNPPLSTLLQATNNTSMPPADSLDRPPTLPTFDPIRLAPGSFTVHLVLDNREVRTKDDRDYIAEELTKKGTKPLVRPLELGDFFWVAKCHDPDLLSHYGEEGSEICLDWIVERKRLDDLVGSITDGRFQEQKFRLRKSGVKNVIYLIEEFSLSMEKSSKYHEAIQSAIASTQVVNGYFVKRTVKLDETIRYLARMTKMLKSLYESKPLYLIPTKTLTPTTYLPLLSHLRTHPSHVDKSYHITYPSFASLSSKSDTLTLRDVFLKMLMCTRGISGDKALAIQKHWGTPRAFIEAFEGCTAQKEREAMIETRLGGMVGRAKIKSVLGAKVAGFWGEE